MEANHVICTTSSPFWFAVYENRVLSYTKDPAKATHVTKRAAIFRVRDINSGSDRKHGPVTMMQDRKY